MELLAVNIDKPEDTNFILGQSHFIKTVEDLHEALVGAVPGIRFGLAFCEASGKRLVRSSGTDEAVRLVHGYDDATELEVTGGQAAYWTNALSESLAGRLPSTAARLDLDLARIDPGSTALALRQATAALHDLRDGEGAPWCASDRKRCLEAALARAGRVEQLAPARCDGFALHAQALLETGDGNLAVKELSDATSVVSDRIPCLEQLVEVALAAKADASLTRALDEIAHAGCIEARECVNNLRFVASFEESRGYPRRALVMLVRAHERDPLDDALLDDTARLASQVDLHAEALKAYEELALRHPEEARWRSAAAVEREAVLRGSVKPP